MKLLSIILLPLVLLGCSGSKETQHPGNGQGSDFRKYESDFRPSDYDPDTLETPFSASAPALADTQHAYQVPVLASTEQVAGFRVQFFSTRNIDEAKRKKEELAAAFPNEWFYLEYDPPTYKIRAGNFQNRFEAERFAKVLVDKGYPSAWAVPTRVLRQPGTTPGNREATELPKQ